MRKIGDFFKKYKKIIILFAVSLVMLVLCVCGVMYIVDYISSQNETKITSDSEEDNKISFHYGSSENEITVDVLQDVNENKLNNDNFTDIDGLKYYMDNGEKKSRIGIDVSEFQHDIDWPAVKASGIEFAMIRVGFRGYTEGGLFEDSNFRKNIEGALENDIEVGVYFFSQAVNEEEAREEADYVADLIDEYDITYPMAFDWEFIDEDDSRTKNLTQSQITSCAVAFCEQAEKRGYKSMVYYSEYYGYVLYDLSKLKDCKMWYVEYSDLPDFYYAFDMWQYSESGQVDGIEGAVDLNVFFDDQQ